MNAQELVESRKPNWILSVVGPAGQQIGVGVWLESPIDFERSEPQVVEELTRHIKQFFSKKKETAK